MLGASGTITGGVSAIDGDSVEQLITFDQSAGELPENITRGGDSLYTSFAFRGVAELDPEAGEYRLLAGFNPGNGFLTGVQYEDGYLYTCVSSFNSTRDADTHGLWRVDAASGRRELVAAFPTRVLLNDLINPAYLDGYVVTDSKTGALWQVDEGRVTNILQDSRLDPRDPSSNTSIGANGIVTLDGDLYVGVTDFGRVVRVPVEDGETIESDVETVLETGALAGIDGLVRDGDTVYGAVNGQNKVVTIGLNGGDVSPVVSDGSTDVDIDFPSDLVLFDDRFYFINFAFAASGDGDGKNPALLKYQ